MWLCRCCAWANSAGARPSTCTGSCGTRKRLAVQVQRRRTRQKRTRSTCSCSVSWSDHSWDRNGSASYVMSSTTCLHLHAHVTLGDSPPFMSRMLTVCWCFSTQICFRNYVKKEFFFYLWTNNPYRICYLDHHLVPNKIRQIAWSTAMQMLPWWGAIDTTAGDIYVRY